MSLAVLPVAPAVCCTLRGSGIICTVASQSPTTHLMPVDAVHTHTRVPRCSVAALLKHSCCIPTESGSLCRPCDVLVCNSSTVRQLLSHQQLHQLLNKHFCHSEVTILHTSPELRAALGVGEFSPLQVVQLIEQMEEAGTLQQQGMQWVQQMLLCLFGMLEVTAAGGDVAAQFPGSSCSTGHGTATSAAAGDAARSWAVQVVQLSRSNVLSKLKKLHVLPLKDGTYGSIEGPAAAAAAAVEDVFPAPVFFPVHGCASKAVGISSRSTGNGSSQLSPAVPASATPNAAAAAAAMGSPAAAAAFLDARAATPGAAAQAAAVSSLQDALQEAGIADEWLSGLVMLTDELFAGLSSDELELMQSGLTVRGWASAL